MSMGEKESIVLQASSLIGNARPLRENLNSLRPEFIIYQHPSGGVLFIFKLVEAALCHTASCLPHTLLWLKCNHKCFFVTHMARFFYYSHSRPEAASIQVSLSVDKIGVVSFLVVNVPSCNN